MWTALVRCKAQGSLLRAKQRRPLNVDYSAGPAGLAIEHGEFAGDAFGQQRPSCITFGIIGTLDQELPAKDDRINLAARGWRRAESISGHPRREAEF
jgi:hypothetical protein